MHVVIQVIVAFLAAVGLLVLGWFLFGHLLAPVGEDTFAVVRADGAGERLEHDIAGLLWLRAGGLARLRVVVADCGLNAEGLAVAKELLKREPDVLFCPADELEQYVREV